MRRPVNRSRASNSTREPSAPARPALNPIVLEAIERFARVLAHCGSRPRELLIAFEAACQRIPAAVIASGRKRPTPELSDASHVLTLWYSDPQYTDHHGVPRSLPVRGDAPSLEALVHRIDPQLRVDVVLGYLLRVQALQREGRRFIPRSRSVALRGTGGPTNFRNLRGLTAMLRTLEHNGRPSRLVRSWFERFAENPRFPVSARAGFDARLERLGMEFLHALDGDMHRRELARKPGETTVRIGVGVYRFEDEIDDQCWTTPKTIESSAKGKPRRRRRSS